MAHVGYGIITMKHEDEIVQHLDRLNTGVKHLQRTLDKATDRVDDRINVVFWLLTIMSSVVIGLMTLLIWVVAG